MFATVTRHLHINIRATFIFTFQEVTLIDNTTQFTRFLTVPFPLNFTLRLWNITNKEEVLAGGVPLVTEAGPYVYK